MKTWKDKIRNVYSSLDNLREWDRVYGIAKRCGYSSCQKLWDDNPTIGGSTNPSDFGIMK